MKHVLKISHRACWLAFALMGGAVLGWTPPLWAGETAPLNILLTNDDGVDAPGIRAVREALLAAGHKVTMVAPIEDHSGSGAQVTTRGSIGYQERSSGVWSVDGFPADAVLIGLLHIMKDEKADLVVAGANFGQNLGYAINSGTVGAATVAMYAGVPAIALSVGVDYAEVSAQPYPFPSTFKAFPGAAELCVRLTGTCRTRAPERPACSRTTRFSMSIIPRRGRTPTRACGCCRQRGVQASCSTTRKPGNRGNWR